MLLCACACAVLGGGDWGVGDGVLQVDGETYRSAFMVDGSSGMIVVLLLNCSGIESKEKRLGRGRNVGR